jgi:hypothetical protein
MYCNTVKFRINGDEDCLKNCWKQMFARQDILRTTFIDTGDPAFPFLQLILARSEFPWVEVPTDSTKLEDDGLPPAVGSFKPPLRLIIHRSGSSTFVQFSCHHALYDGSAMAILADEVEALYYRRNLPPAISATPFLREMISQRTPQHIQFWVEHLDGLQPVVLRTRGRKQKLTSQAVASPLSSLETRCHELSVSLLSLCQTAWATTLSVLLDTTDVCFGNVVSGRSLPAEDLHRLVAPTFNTIPFRIDLLQRHKNIDVLKAAQRMNAASINHQLCPLRTIQSHLGFAETGIFSSILLLQHFNLELDSNIWSLEYERGIMDVGVSNTA